MPAGRAQRQVTTMSTPSDSDVIRLPNLQRDRDGTLRLMSWWQQDRVKAAKVMVVGAGALGNEVAKNLTLMGVGHLFVIDRDEIEAANLSRSVLFRESDNGRLKTEAAAAAIKDLNPEVKVQTFNGDVNTDLGLGVFRRMDVVVGCLDNRQARLSVNRFCWKANRPWVDGAIQELFGVARVFVPERGACYECTLTERDWQILSMQHPCKGIALGNLLEGKVPTTPTISSIIAGVQSQEALKLIHGMDDFVLNGKALVFNGLTNDVYVTEYREKEFCDSHYVYDDIVECADLSAAGSSVGEALERIRSDLDQDAVIGLDREIVLSLECFPCKTKEPALKPQDKLFVEDAKCPTCGEIREPTTTHNILGNEDFLDRSLADLGIPPLHIVEGRSNAGTRFYELTGDLAETVQFG